MSEQDNENINSQNDEIIDIDSQFDDEQEDSQFVDLESENQKLKEQNKKLFARLKRTKPQFNKDINQAVDYKLQSRLDKIELKTEGYQDEEIDFILKNGGKEGLKNPMVQAAIEATRKQKAAEQAVVAQDSAKSDIEKKYSEEEMRNMSVDELRKILPHKKD